MNALINDKELNAVELVKYMSDAYIESVVNASVDTPVEFDDITQSHVESYIENTLEAFGNDGCCGIVSNIFPTDILAGIAHKARKAYQAANAE